MIPNYTLTQLTICSRAGSYERLQPGVVIPQWSKTPSIRPILQDRRRLLQTQCSLLRWDGCSETVALRRSLWDGRRSLWNGRSRTVVFQWDMKNMFSVECTRWSVFGGVHLLGYIRWSTLGGVHSIGGVYLVECTRWSVFDSVEYTWWSTLGEVYSVDYTRWNTLGEVHSVEYARWSILDEVHLVEYPRWSTLSGVHSVEYIWWSILGGVHSLFVIKSAQEWPRIGTAFTLPAVPPFDVLHCERSSSTRSVTIHSVAFSICNGV